VVSVDRLRGYRAALEEQGIQMDAALVEHSEFSVDGGFTRLPCAFCRSSWSFSAIFAVDDLIAIGAMRALQERGFAVGERRGGGGLQQHHFGSLCPAGLNVGACAHL